MYVLFMDLSFLRFVFKSALSNSPSINNFKFKNFADKNSIYFR